MCPSGSSKDSHTPENVVLKQMNIPLGRMELACYTITIVDCPTTASSFYHRLNYIWLCLHLVTPVSLGQKAEPADEPNLRDLGTEVACDNCQSVKHSTRCCLPENLPTARAG